MAPTPQLPPVSFLLFLSIPGSLPILTVNYLLLGKAQEGSPKDLSSNERPPRVGFAQKEPGLVLEPFLHLRVIDIVS